MPWPALWVEGKVREHLKSMFEHQFVVCVENWQMKQSGERKPAKWLQKCSVSMMLPLVCERVWLPL